MKRSVAALFGAAVLMAALPAAAADFVVLESNVSTLTPGSMVPGSRKISLDAGARVVMIAADGSTRAVSGPYAGAVSEAGSSAAGALERLTTQRGDSNHVVGAIRAPAWDQQ